MNRHTTLQATYEVVDWLPETWVECRDCENAGSFRVPYRGEHSHCAPETRDCETCDGKGGHECDPRCVICGYPLDEGQCHSCELVYRPSGWELAERSALAMPSAPATHERSLKSPPSVSVRIAGAGK